ncbi:DUF1127 domain-containing protein [Afifella sp. IM 167]|uniref:DUF1127 domain-containing protein n=1 Tax=Afifella sp. IM 167 TaxID=2033586 RepID=UPI001CCE2132|nr:DUF1127 domain-containing protein [Afifella sp. IM 167]MBZ8133061.1 hypothetical protein [Afifella sp. IM 167]
MRPRIFAAHDAAWRSRPAAVARLGLAAVLLGQLARNRRAARDMRHLRNLSTRQLDDIGLTHRDLR